MAEPRRGRRPPAGRVVIRLGPLAEPVERAARKAGLPVSRWIRALIAAELHVDEPPMRPGRPPREGAR